MLNFSFDQKPYHSEKRNTFVLLHTKLANVLKGFKINLVDGKKIKLSVLQDVNFVPGFEMFLQWSYLKINIGLLVNWLIFKNTFLSHF